MSEYSGYKRSLYVSVTKRTDGIIDDGYPKTYPTATDIANGYFTYHGVQYTIPNDNELSYMSATTYNNLVSIFILYVNEIEEISIDESQVNDNIEYDPIECDPNVTPPTTTTIEPTTTVEPQTPIDYDIRFECTPFLSEVILENYYGGSGVYEVGSYLSLTESQALNTTSFDVGLNPYSYLAISDGIYWAVVRDVNNPTNIVAKMIEVICSSTTTVEPTTTAEPTTTVEPTTLEPTTTTTIEPTTTEPPIYLANCYTLDIPYDDLEDEAFDELYITYYLVGGGSNSLSWVEFEDDGGYVDGIRIKICSTIEPSYKYGTSGFEFFDVEWIDDICTTCCNDIIDCGVNQPPVAYDNTVTITRWITVCSSSVSSYPDLSWFPYSDYDGDSINAIKITTLPQYGEFSKGAIVPIVENEIIPYPFEFDSRIFYRTSGLMTGSYVDTVEFQVRTDNNPNWSNTATITFNVSYCVTPTTTEGPPEPSDCVIFVPEGFSPTLNDGIHDYFEVWNLDCYPVHRMSIFTRDGSLLYQRTNDYVENPWDGKVNGVIISTTRLWVLEIDGEVHSTGTVFVN